MLGYNTEQSVIESIFTSSLKKQDGHISREKLKVSSQDFLLVIVGGRLDYEVTDDFLFFLEKLLQEKMFVGFLGVFHAYDERIKKYPRLKRKSAFWGFRKDILSYLEICDLYVNPVRKGGGTSSVEAMFKGIPVVTTDYGDVAVNAGEEFCVKDYREMSEEILRYYMDKEYYREMSKRALERAKGLLDTETEFVRIMKEAEKREITRHEIKEYEHAGHGVKESEYAGN